MSFHKLLFLSVFILLILPGCYAPPIDEQPSVESQQGSRINMSKTYIILKTIILGYLTHIMTIRPSPDTDQTHTLFQRITYFIYPTMGISSAIVSIILAWKNDEILGIDKHEKVYKEINKPIPIWSKAFAKSLWKTIKEIRSQAATSIRKFFKPDKKPPSENPEKPFADAVADMENKYYEYCGKIKPDRKYIVGDDSDNSIYLAAILNTLEPSQAKKVKDCFLNNSLYLGLDLKDSTIKDDESKELTMKDDISLIKDKLLYTKNMTITGPGAICRYQIPIRPQNVCFLTREMLNQLQPVHYLDNTSYIAICITSGQLVYTLIECIDADGDRWAKVIMLIYTVMSVLQTISLIVLHKQLAAYSIHYNEDIKLADNFGPKYDDSEIIEIMPEYITNIEKKHDDNLLCYRGSFLEKLNNNENLTSRVVKFLQKKGSFTLSGLGGLGLSLLIGIWADYTARSTTQWIVLAWILSPFLSFPIYLIRNNIYPKKRWLYIPFMSLFYLTGIGGAGCVIAATIEGYSIKD
ncbi:hypothetical protein CLU79DRAFT_732053 [Phycomyces nitens]|nr:hypothetical protein CLU79DRAFT_732053 [Phycomyces nitens]